MHTLLIAAKWLGIFLAWGGSVFLCWALVRVGSERRYDEAPSPEPERVPTDAAVSGKGAPVIPLRARKSASAH